MKRLPVFTIVALIGALLAAFLPGLHDEWIYDRTAILQGEVWRLLTGHLVHFSSDVFWYNIAATAIAGSLVELRTEASRLVLFPVMALVIGLSLLVTAPRIAQYAGLSGVATGLLIFVALDFSTQRGVARWLGFSALIFFLLKTGGEHWLGRPVFASQHAGTQVATLAHLAGALFALVVFLLRARGLPNKKEHPLRSALLIE